MDYEIKNVQILVKKLDPKDFNPWAVSNASIFLQYNCPECEFKCKEIATFSTHALEHHERSKILFSYPDQDEHPFCNEDPLWEVSVKNEMDTSDEDTAFEPKKKKRKTEKDSNTPKDFKNWEDFESEKSTIDLHALMETTEDSFKCLACPKIQFQKKFELASHLIEEHAQSIKNIEVCQFCVEVFQSESELDEHYQKVHPSIEKTTYTCKLCNLSKATNINYKEFRGFQKSFHSLQKHYKTKHQYFLPILPYHCSKCASRFLIEEELLEHEALDHIDCILPDQKDSDCHSEFKCDKCSMTFRSKSNFTVHQFVHGDIQAVPERCKYCGFASELKQELVAHHSKNHPTTEPPYFFCEKCDHETSTSAEMIVHCKEQHDCEYLGYKCNKCPHMSYSTISKLMKHLWKHQNRAITKKQTLVKCSHCNDFEGTSHEHDKHMTLKHPELGSQICHKCGFLTEDPAELKKHIKNKHRIRNRKLLEPKHKCDFCGHMFKEKSHMRNHVDRAHPDCGLEKNYACEVCGEQFVYESSITIHKRRHCGKEGKRVIIKPYLPDDERDIVRTSKKAERQKIFAKEGEQGFPCEYCGRILLTKAYKRRHEMKCDPKPQGMLVDVKLKCHVCENSYFCQRKLEVHIERYHTEVMCEECDFKANDMKHLGLHIRQHHKLENHTCEHCNKTFETLYKYRHHVKQSHNKVKCEFCSKELLNKWFLNKHLALEHGVDENAYFCPICPKTKFICFKEHVLKTHLKEKHDLQYV